ncbi:MAG: hypothetical protein HY326_01785 [Chloroflexi bacterium]|nr:hypothetical protein [Chloroflexota bacterium]
MKIIILIACASEKLPYKAKAADLYTSPLFEKSLQYARRLKPDHIFILSAKHGLLDLDQVIEPYNLTLNTMPAAQVKAWAARVLGQLKQRADLRSDHFIFLAGHKYRKYLVPHLISYAVPMEGLTIGKQLQYLKGKNDE